MSRRAVQSAAVAAAVVLGVGSWWSAATLASDHGDTPQLIEASRHDARLTDLYAFTRGGDLVIALCLDPTIPTDVATYRFASDLDLRIYIDTNAAVSFDDPDDTAVFGGTIEDPERIKWDVRFRVRFTGSGEPRLKINGLSHAARRDVLLFAGLRDDPFIRGPRIGRNVAAVVIQVPLDDVVDRQDTLLIWATAKVPDFSGPFQEMAGRALRSQFIENMPMNSLPPHRHERAMNTVPDVMIYDTSLPASFPNGRELVDDVVDLVGDPRVLKNDDPFPTENDLPFSDAFPYLAAPHPPH